MPNSLSTGMTEWRNRGADRPDLRASRGDAITLRSGGVRLVVQPGTPNVSGRRMVKQVFFHRVPVEPGDRAQPAGDPRPGPAFGFQITGEVLDVSAAGLEQAD